MTATGCPNVLRHRLRDRSRSRRPRCAASARPRHPRHAVRSPAARAASSMRARSGTPFSIERRSISAERGELGLVDGDDELAHFAVGQPLLLAELADRLATDRAQCRLQRTRACSTARRARRPSCGPSGARRAGLPSRGTVTSAPRCDRARARAMPTMPPPTIPMDWLTGGASSCLVPPSRELVVPHRQRRADGHVHVEVLVGAEPAAEVARPSRPWRARGRRAAPRGPRRC